MRRWAAAGLICFASGLAHAEEIALPPDPLRPTDASACTALYAGYQKIVDRLRADAKACNTGHSSYTLGRYGRQAGTGACARRTVSQCRHLVTACTDTAKAADAALKRCRTAVRSAKKQ